MGKPKRLAILTTGRQDYGILRSTVRALGADHRFEMEVWAGGMHLSRRFGRTIELLLADGVPVTLELDFLTEDHDEVATTARALEVVGRALAESRPDALVLVGDRTETLAAAAAATLSGVPIAHLHGGEETEGAIDNACRHAITKLSHLHLVSHEQHAERVRQMGEQPETVVVVGAAGLDNAYRKDLPSRKALEEYLGAELEDPVVVVTVHPTTLGGEPLEDVVAVAEAMERVDARYVITAPNADAGGHAIREFWDRWVPDRQGAFLREALGEARYWGILRIAAAVLGNSSSGIIEAPALGIPVVNVGARQAGRFRYGSVRDVPADPHAVADALAAALREGRSEVVDGYPTGPAAPRIVEALARWEMPRPPRKRFSYLT